MSSTGALPDRRPTNLRAVLRPVRGALAVAVGAQAIGSVAGLVPLLCIAELGRLLLPGLHGEPVDSSRAWFVVWVAGAALLVRLVITMAAAVVTHAADLRLAHDIRSALLAQLGRVPLAWFGRRNSGVVRKAVIEDVEALHVLVAHAALEITAAVVVPAAAIVYLAGVDWLLTVFTVLPLVCAVLAYRAAMRGAMTLYPHYERSLATLAARAVEFVHGVTVVKAFGSVGRAHGRFQATADEFADFFHGWVARGNRANLLVEFATAPATTLLVVLVGGLVRVETGALEPVEVLPFLLLGLGLGAPVLTLSFGMVKLREAQQAAHRLGEVFATPTIAVPEHGVTPNGTDVEFRDVVFSYDGETRALDGVSLRLRPGTVTALVGPSGSGKSTLARLLPRFADVASGSVRIGGVDVRDIAPAELYRQVGFVFQETELLRMSIRDNIALARPDATLDEVRAVARAAQVDERIRAFDRGYDAVVGTDAMLSGGEAQRVCIARALLADAPVLVLDEATAFADPDSEAAIQDALSVLLTGRTVLVIAHRLHTLTQVDAIAVLERGRITETGTHSELVAAGGRYARMWEAAERARANPIAVRPEAAARTGGAR